MAGPLEGIRVFDLTLMMVGPWSTQNLGQMGAEVFHVDRGGVDGRSLGGNTPPSINGTSVVYMTCNMNKRGVFLDLKEPYDQHSAIKLAASCDVFVQNMRPGVMDRLGLGYEALKKINPRIVYLAVSGWGESGPMSDKTATDNRVQAFAGFSALNGVPGSDGEAYRHYTQLDGSSGNYITQAVLLGLLARERTGRGQLIHITMAEAAMALQASRMAEYLATSKQPVTLGSASSAYAPNEAFLCEENVYIGLEAKTDGQWQALCRSLGLDDMLADPRFSTNALRLENRAALSERIAKLLVTKPARWWSLKLNKAGVPNAVSARFPELIYHPQTRDNLYMQECDTEQWGRFFTGGLAWRFWRTPAEARSAHMVGEDTADVLDECDRLPEPVEQPGPAAIDDRPPLVGVRVIELAQGISGPYTGMQLSDAGADVIKVEYLGGDIARHWEPRGADGLGAAFIQLNRGKRSVELDLTSPEGIDTIRELIAGADVLIEDADLVRDLGLDMDALTAGNSRLVRNRISGFGPEGPWKDLPATEIGAQLASEVTTSLGKFGEPPVRVGADLASTYAGVSSTQAILAALYRRARDGQGQRIDVSLFGCLVVLRSIMWAALSNPDDWSGFHLDSFRKPPEGGFKAKDGRVSMTLGRLSDEGWANFARDLGFDLERDRDKVEFLKEIGNPDTSPRGWESRPVWEEVLANFTVEEVLEILDRNGAGGFPMNDYARLFAHPQVKILDVLNKVRTSSGAEVTVLRSPWRLSETPQRVEQGPPALGQHTQEVMRDMRAAAGAVAG